MAFASASGLDAEERRGEKNSSDMKQGEEKTSIEGKDEEEEMVEE